MIVCVYNLVQPIDMLLKVNALIAILVVNHVNQLINALIVLMI